MFDPSPLRRAAWVPLGGVLLALIYFPTLSAPFDFIDDGNLVYPAPPGTTLNDHFHRYADKLRANVDHLGPFRPVLWAHWELAANLFGGDALAWRGARLVWCCLAATAFLAFLRSLNIPPLAAFLAGLAAFANPYRNEIWTSLTLAEGVAMPYCLTALWSARRAASSSRPARWDGLALGCFLAALGCKNTFAALAPALIVLRVWPDGLSLRTALKTHGRRGLLYALPLGLVAAHFVYFKLNWKPGQYDTPGPSWTQLGKMLSWLKGAAGLDFVGVAVGSMIVLGIKNWHVLSSWRQEWFNRYRAAVVVSVLLFVSGVAVYLPLPMMAARYTMPAIWGVDIAFALLLTMLFAFPQSLARRTTLIALAVGLLGLVAANIGRQEKVAARSKVLWAALEHLETTAPLGTRLEWRSGPHSAQDLNVEEGIHFRWHLLHRGRGDVEIGLFGANGEGLDRVELPPMTGPAQVRLSLGTGGAVEFTEPYWFGRKRFTCRLEGARPVSPAPSDQDWLRILTATRRPDAPALAARQ